MLDTIVVQNGSLLIPSVRTKFSDDAKVTDEDTKKASYLFSSKCSRRDKEIVI